MVFLWTYWNLFNHFPIWVISVISESFAMNVFVHKFLYSPDNFLKIASEKWNSWLKTNASKISIKGLWCVPRITFPFRKTTYKNTPPPPTPHTHCLPQCCLPLLHSIPFTASLATQETVVFILIKSVWLLDLRTSLGNLLHTIRKIFSNIFYLKSSCFVLLCIKSL